MTYRESNPCIHNVPSVEDILSSEPVEKREHVLSGTEWIFRGQFVSVVLCAIAWGPVKAGCISDFHSFQSHRQLRTYHS